ncbi:MAG: ADP-ribosylglycohydrolase family protein [Actinobacteria bacterium]|nr:ADP-ribosylglycohydrolase family protein [Actinomycetota bacterium]
MVPGNKPDGQLLRRAAGCLAGVAVGDALGGPLEGYDTEQIATQFVQLKEMMGGGYKGLAPGDTSDDTAHTRIMAESIAACGRLNPSDLAQRLADWYRYDGFGIGHHTESVLLRISEGEDWEQASLEVQAANPESAGNGSLMRCSPVALLRHNEPELLIEESRLSSRVTHPHSFCQWSCVFADLLLARLLTGEDPSAAFDAVFAYCSDRKDFPLTVLERANRARSPRAGESLNPSGYVLDSLECALWAFLNHRSFEQTLVAAVNLGGDADTIGSIAGALAGTAYGLHAIPGRWLVHVSGWPQLQDLASEIIKLA